MSISNNKVLVSLVVAGFTLASATAGAQDHSPNGYDSNYDGRYEDSEGIYDYAKVVDVQPADHAGACRALRSANAGTRRATNSPDMAQACPAAWPAVRCLAP